MSRKGSGGQYIHLEDFDDPSQLLRWLLLSPAKAVHSFEDTFSKFVVSCKQKSIHADTMDKVLNELLKVMEASPDLYERDFPIYIVASYLLSQDPEYRRQRNMVETFVVACTQNVENMKSETLAFSIKAFLARPGIKIHCELMRNAFRDFAKQTSVAKDSWSEVAVHNSSKVIEVTKRLPSDFMHRCIIWTSLALACHSKLNIGTEDGFVRETWNECFVKHYARLVLDEEAVGGMRAALDFHFSLALPQACQFSGEQFLFLAIKGNIMRPFLHMRNYIEVLLLKDLVTPKHMQGLYFIYEEWLRTSCACYKEKQLFQMLKEGLELVELIDAFYDRRNLESASRLEIQKWLSVLLQLVDVTHGDARSCLELFFCDKYNVTTKHCEHLSPCLFSMVKKNFEHLSADQLLLLYKLPLHVVWPKQFLYDYLVQCKVDPHISICDETWQQLLREIALSCPQECILTFLKKVSSHYNGDIKFVLDMLQLNVAGLFHTVELTKQFKSFLKTYMRQSVPHLLENLPKILDAVQANTAEFHNIILSVIHEMVSTALNKAPGCADPSTLNLIKERLLSSPDKILSPCLQFCCKLITAYCDAVPISSKNLLWVQSHLFVIENVGEVCCKFGQKHRSNPDLSKCIEFLGRASEVLKIWCSNLEGKQITHDELLQYANLYNDLMKLTYALGLNSDLIVELEALGNMKDEFSQQFEQLNVHLIKHVPETPELYPKFCTLTSLLATFGIKFPSGIQNSIDAHVMYPNRNVAASLTQWNHAVNTSSQFMTRKENTLFIKKDATLKELIQLNERISSFLQPISECLYVLVFFQLNPSKLFSNYLGFQLEMCKDKSYAEHLKNSTMHFFPVLDEVRQISELGCLKEATSKSKSMLYQLLDGTAKYSDMTGDFTLDLKKIDVVNEVKVLSRFFSLCEPQRSQEGLSCLHDILQLWSISAAIQNIHNVCEQYQLQGCLHDTQLKELIGIADGVKKNAADLTPAVAAEELKKSCFILCLSPKSDFACLKLFSAAGNSAEFHKFIIEKKYIGPEGRQAFHQQYQLVTAQLQHEQYNDTILNHLYAAYELIVLFTDPNQSLHDLMSALASINDICAGLMHLETVNANISQIYLWFSNTEEDSMQVLEAIIGTGYYEFCLDSHPPDLKLCFKYGQITSQSSEESGFWWNLQQVNEFIAKLGFVDCSRDTKCYIKRFYHVHEATLNLLNLYFELKRNGHPAFFKEQFIRFSLCTTTEEEADYKVKNIRNEAENWSKRIKFLQSQYKWLLFFPISKILVLYNMIKTTASDVNRITQEVSILISNTPEQQKELSGRVHHAAIAASQEMDCDPLEHVGMFLDTTFRSHSLPIARVQTLPTHEGFHVLHRLHGCSNIELVQLIVTIYDGIPEPFEVFYCQNSPTQKELELFLERTCKFPRQYIMLEVNKLPYQLQEHLLHFSGWRKYTENGSYIHLVETAQSPLGEMPGILVKDGAGIKPINDVQSICLKFAAPPEDLAGIKLIYGHAGNGKSHYIKKQLSKYRRCVVVPINEVFTPLLAIEKLRTLNPSEEQCAIYFNVTLLPSHVTESNKKSSPYTTLMKSISWFFFDLLILGYVEDQKSGLSFRIPRGLLWSFFIEVPFYESPEQSLEWFKKVIPTLQLLGNPSGHYDLLHYTTDDSVQIVCKYLKAFNTGDIDKRVYKKDGPHVKFSTDPDLDKRECHVLLNEKMPKSIQNNKTSQRLFVEYMNRRCRFIERMPSFLYKTSTGHKSSQDLSSFCPDTTHLGSTLMEAMLHEVCELCDPDKVEWSSRHHQQLVYDCIGGGGSVSFITLHPDQVTEKEQQNFSKLGIKFPNNREEYTTEVLHDLLSKALGVPLNSKKRLKAIVESNYVLTLDYALKMLDINERRKCGIPVIIEGETGVGKTAMIEVLSKLWNPAVQVIGKFKQNAIAYLQEMLGRLEFNENFERCVTIVEALSSEDAVTLNDMLLLCNLQDDSSQKPLCLWLYENTVCDISKHEHLMPLVEVSEKYKGPCLEECLLQADQSPFTAETIASVLYVLFSAHVKSTFLKVNIHATLTPDDIRKSLQPMFALATELKSKFDKFQAATFEYESTIDVPFVTIFFDEMNASSCPGLFKEIIVDKSFNGEPIPHNVFIVAACNPHRGNSLAFYENSWVRETYRVHQLHPTLRLLTWDYGSLGIDQEVDYIHEKLRLLNKMMSNDHICCLRTLISESQKAIREFSREHLINCGATEENASVASKSSVSQRDIQRVITMYEWFMSLYQKYKPHGAGVDYNRRAVMVAIGIVYYMRLNQGFRKQYVERINQSFPSSSVTFKAFQEEVDWFSDHIYLPPGIAKTETLKENIFAVIICTCTRTPLVIVGPPGSSKTLSFNLVVLNLKGKESRSSLFRDAELFPSLAPYYYQCSCQSTSSEIDKVFQRAINRQDKFSSAKLQTHCVVCIDEAGLPDDRHESLKVLHHYLDNPLVSFVATSNHMLDAAKTNRAITLFRSEISKEDLITLAKGCFFSNNDDRQSAEMKHKINDIITQLCIAYRAMMAKSDAMKRFFGLRDFIYFIYYLRNHCSDMLPPQVIMEGLERNFNGSDHFEDICKIFLPNDYNHVTRRNIIDVIRESVDDAYFCRENSTITGDEHMSKDVRYKLFIDASEDESLMRFLFAFDILKQKNTKFICMDYSVDHSQKVSVIAAVRKCMADGYTVVMSQSGAIHESFYDLFNQRFRRINDPTTGVQYYANIAIGDHTKPSKVHQHFQCVVVIKKSDIGKTALPLLNRFEKYVVTHSTLLEAALSLQPPCLRDIVLIAKSKLTEFSTAVGGAQSLCGFQEGSTVDSLILSMLPLKPNFAARTDDEAVPMHEMSQTEPGLLFLQQITAALKSRAGFSFSSHWTDSSELAMDARYLLSKALKEDSDLGSIDIDSLTAQSICDGTSDGLSLIFGGGSRSVSIIGHMSIKLTTMGLVLYLCKRLMQLMTSTGIITHINTFPPRILESYLHRQTHFSLNQLLKHYFDDQSPCSPTKIICFSSCLTISELSKPSTLEKIDPLQRNGGNSIAMNNLSHLPSESIPKLLDDFVASSKHILLLVANIDEVSHAKLNYTRILIEESESNSLGQRKLFVILVGYGCLTGHLQDVFYPSLFLNGWDHLFLHTLQECEDGFNLRHWIMQSSALAEEGSFAQSLSAALKKHLSSVASKVPQLLSLAFHMFEEAGDQIKYLLLQADICFILCAKFVSYFTKDLVLKRLQKSVQCLTYCGASRGIMESMKSEILDDLVDFFVIMMSRIIENCSLLILVPRYHLFHQLLVDMIDLIPLPEYTDIQYLGAALPSCITPSALNFPFFKMAFDEIECIIETLCDKKKIHSYDNQVVNSLYEEVLRHVNKHLHQDDTSVIKVFMTAVRDSNELWSIYFDSFLCHKYNLMVQSSELIKDIVVKAYFGDFGKMENIKKVLWLHVYSRVQDLNLFKVIHVLGQIVAIQNSGSDIHTHFPIHKPAITVLPSGITSTQHLAPLAIEVLFNYLMAASQELQEQCGHSSAITSWFNHYKDVIMALGSFMDNTLNNSGSRASVSKLNIMQAIYMILQFFSDSSILAERIFSELHKKHFDENEDLIQYCDLRSILNTLESLNEDLCSGQTVVCRAIEWLLNHFFSTQRHDYDPNDIQSFLELANRQYHWCSFHDEKQSPFQHSLETFKLYLSRILRAEKPKNPSEPFNRTVRDLILCTLAQQPSFSECSQHFVPYFYTNLLQEGQHDQAPKARSPLAHLYFATLLESSQGKMHTFAGLIDTAKEVKKRCVTSREEAALLNIELQVILQTILQQIANCLVDTQGDSRLKSEIGKFQTEIDEYLRDPSRGGGSDGFHNHVLGQLLLRRLGSQKFIGLVSKLNTAQYSHIICMKPVATEIEGLQRKKVPFVLVEENVLSTVRMMLLDIHSGKKYSANDIMKQAQTTKNFAALVWFIVYREFFKNKISSPRLSSVLREQLGLQCYLTLLESFLDPTLKQNEHNDRIFDFFFVQKESSDLELRECVCNTIAVVMCCPKSTHLWHHMFEPAKLMHTGDGYFMHGIKAVCSSEQIESIYLHIVGLGTCSLTSFYVLLWIVFAGLCVSLLCQKQSAQDAIAGLLGPSASPQCCISWLKSVWSLMKEALSLTDEERSHLVTCVLKQILQSQISSSAQWIEQSCFVSGQEMKQFLALWDSQIYQPALSTAKATFPKYESKLLRQIRVLDCNYPKCLKKSQFVHQIVNQLTLDQQKKGGEFHLLTKAAFEWERLKAGESILVKLIQFYTLLHSQLAYTITYEEVQTITVSDIFCKHINLSGLYEEIKTGYNSYIQLSQRSKLQKIPPLSDSSLLGLLLSDPLKRPECKDYLFAVISNICTLHNDFLGALYSSQHLSHFVSSKPLSSVELLNVSDDCCLTNKHDSFHGLEELLPLMHRLRGPFAAALDSFGAQEVYDLKHFQEDMVLMYLSGKQRIDCCDEKRRKFFFKIIADENSVTLRSSAVCPIPKSLSSSLNAPLSHSLKQELEFIFHSANLSTLNAVTQGLQKAIEFIAEAVTATSSTVAKRNPQVNLNEVTLVSFVQLHSTGLTPITEDAVLSKFGVYSLSNTQEHVLGELPVCNLLSTVQLFVEWVEDEKYDFCDLPFPFKSQMEEQDLIQVQQLDKNWKGDLDELYEHLITMNSALIFFHGKVAKESLSENRTIADFIRCLFSAEKQPQFLSLIPSSVKIQCYTTFALAVRRTLKKIASELNKSKQIKIEQWDDRITDLQKRLEPYIKISHPEVSMATPPTTPPPIPVPIVPVPIASDSPIRAPEVSGDEYTPEDVGLFLRWIGMDQYVEAFLREEITGEIILNPNSDDLLKELGITSAIERNRLRRELKKTIKK